MRAHSEDMSGEWRLSLLPLRPLEKVPSDIEVREDIREEVAKELWMRWGPERVSRWPGHRHPRTSVYSPRR